MAAPETIGRLQAVLAGRARPYTRPGTQSAIDKLPVQGDVLVGPRGLAGDEQGDQRVHGGPDKAVHCYPWPHYPIWRSEIAAFAEAPLLQTPGAFGENFSVVGPDESTVCLADQCRIGTAVFEVSQGRQPCWKLNDRFGVPNMARRVQESLRAGWYLRVLESGRVRGGDAIVLLARPYPEWPLARLLAAIRDRRCEPSLLEPILELPLPDSWRKLFRTRLERGQAEAWEKRLEGARDAPDGQFRTGD